ncbi:iron-containing alcohol dehydrogenase [Alkalihalobacillus sp. MEB130]|uniref:iron-containing alcohol dehydrogenase n=1 Tax=Alkalihalobacillus sp. MEB130 TaxID=2976704 RepID=UPI0028DEE088|nr:iron-containing alcohol dehydrogenase [Alkalihalobacillus sp. MEB130]MDT8861655.1 iron-containing alcohol dehydrogenase [Alkalihalobacillus sp. MEB130]
MINKFVMPEVIFGSGSINQVGECSIRLGARKVFIVCDPGIVNEDWLEMIIRSCKEVDLDYVVFSNLTVNPKDYEVEEGRRLYLDHECDSVIGLGGGSAIDVAKAIALLSTNKGNIQLYEGIDQIQAPLPPQVMIPTTAGSGSEVSQFSIIIDSVRKKKMTIVSKSLIPDIAIIDPQTLSSKPPSLTAATGLDVLTHAIEAYVSVAATPLTDVQAQNAIALVANHLRPSVASKANLEAKTKMAMASVQAGLAFSNAILGAVHAMSHAVGGRFPFSHGDVNAVLLPHVMEFNLLACPKKFATIATLLGEDSRGLSNIEAARKGIEHIKKLSLDIGAPQSLSQMGLDEENITEMSITALEDACMITNPRDISLSDVERLFRQSL